MPEACHWQRIYMTEETKIRGALHGAPELESYTQLLRSLLPRMIGVSIFGAAGDVLWSNEMSVDASLGKIVAEAMRAAAQEPGSPGLLHTDGEPLYIFWLLRTSGAEQGQPFAAVLLRCRAGPENEQRSLAYVHAMVRPALDILARELQSREQIVTLSGSLAEQDHDLDMLLAVSGGEAARRFILRYLLGLLRSARRRERRGRRRPGGTPSRRS